ncbi:hypothetical protein MKFW12EY_14080 [Methylomonas koyamae]|nr:hypothetical protein MKFW12EY_14080 [Methylomonas koyamae]
MGLLNGHQGGAPTKLTEEWLDTAERIARERRVPWPKSSDARGKSTPMCRRFLETLWHGN